MHYVDDADFRTRNREGQLRTGEAVPVERDLKAVLDGFIALVRYTEATAYEPCPPSVALIWLVEPVRVVDSASSFRGGALHV